MGLEIQKILINEIVANIIKTKETEKILFGLSKTKSKQINEFIKLATNVNKKIKSLKNIEQENVDLSKYRELEKDEALYEIYLKFSYVLYYCA